MELIEILGFLLAGLVGGFLAGMLGVGGGIVFVPVIQQVLIMNHIGEDFVSYTLANSLAIVFAVGISGTIKQVKLRNTHLPSALVTGFSAIASSLGITFVFTHYGLTDQKVFNAIFAVILILTALRMLFSRKSSGTNDELLTLPSLPNFVPAGLFAGFVTALSGLGGGVVMVPYFNKILKLPIKFATGLSLSVIPIIAFPLLVFYGIKIPVQVIYEKYQTGYLVWPVVLPVIGVAIFASRWGVKVSQKLQSNTIKWIFITFVIITLVKILLF